MISNMDKLEWALKEIEEWANMKLKSVGVISSGEIYEKVHLALMDCYYTGSEDGNQETQPYIY